MLKFLLPAAVVALSATGAVAHATFEQGEAAQAKTTKFVARIGHGCEGEATLKLRIQIPDGVVSVKPMPKAGWTLETVTGPYSKTFSNGYADVSEGVTEIIWTGELPDAFYDEFVFRGVVSDAFAIDSTVYVPIVQECATKSEAWIEVPAEGQSSDELEMPAPGIKVITGGSGH